MLRTLSRSTRRSTISNRPSNSEVAASPTRILNATASLLRGQSAARPSGSWTGTAVTSRQSSPQVPFSAIRTQCFSSMGNAAVQRWKTQPTSLEWDDRGFPVAPVLSAKQKLPSNLKLAVGALPEEQGEDANDVSAEDSDLASDEEDSDFCPEEDAELLSGEDLDAIASLLDIPAFATTEVDVISWAGETPAGERSLNPSVFGVPVRRDVVHDVIRWQLARRRSGNGKTKRIAEVSGSGRKVRAQKGGGIARAGHSRPPHWRGGAKAHGPRMRDFSFKLNKKFIKLGLRVALSARLREGRLKVVDDLKCDTFSTSAVLKNLEAKGMSGDVTFIVGGDPQPEFLRSTSNIIGVKVLPARGANVYDIIKRSSLVLTEDAVVHLEQLLETD